MNYEIGELSARSENALIITPAEPHDVAQLLAFREEAAALATRSGIRPVEPPVPCWQAAGHDRSWHCVHAPRRAHDRWNDHAHPGRGRGSVDRRGTRTNRRCSSTSSPLPASMPGRIWVAGCSIGRATAHTCRRSVAPTGRVDNKRGSSSSTTSHRASNTSVTVREGTAVNGGPGSLGGSHSGGHGWRITGSPTTRPSPAPLRSPEPVTGFSTSSSPRPSGRGRGRGGGGGGVLRRLSRAALFPRRAPGAGRAVYLPVEPRGVPIEVSSGRIPRWSARSRRQLPAGGPCGLWLWPCGGLLPSAHGAQANGFVSRRYESHPTGPPRGPAPGSGTGATLLPAARSAPPPGPAPPTVATG